MASEGARPPPHAASASEVLAELGVDLEEGLSPEEARARLEAEGPNQLRAPERRSVASIVVAQLESLIVALLVVAAIVSFAFGHLLEGAAVLAVVIINTALGAFTELRAVRSMEALRALGDVETTVRRGSEAQRVPAQQLVRGDVLLVEGGDRLTADARIVEASRLVVDESTLTGESAGVDKSEEPAPEDAPLAERTCMLFKGTVVTRGTAEAVVVATGVHTELGRIAELVEEIEDRETPLEKRLARLGRQLLWVSLAFATLVGVSGAIAGRDLFLIVETAIALAVATVPEGLPIVATLALARGMLRMARRNALVEELSAVETLGSTSLILTDKTGTLTENRMTATRLALATGDEPVRDTEPSALARSTLEAAVLCNGAELGDEEAVGDPMEVALLVAGRRAGLERAELLERLPEVHEEAFDPGLKMMATVHADGDGYRFAVKGAPEAILPVCVEVLDEGGSRPLDEAEREAWLERSHALADEGLRLLAIASRGGSSADESPYRELTLHGLIALVDPPREDVKRAIARIRDAGLRLVMATGDHAATGRYVAKAVGLAEEHETIEGPALGRDAEAARRASVIARASPEDKLTLLSLHQEAGEVVAMLGDGVNDAPALEKADIGVAMGRRGTDVAREAADMVLLDDRLGTVVVAIEQGRVIFENIRKFAVYLLACNLSEILVIGIASALSAPLPLLPLQILFLNLVTDVFPALALAGGEATHRVMERPPRPKHEAILAAPQWRMIALHGALLTAAVLAAFAVALRVLELDTERAVTIAFLTIGFAQLVEVFNVADRGGPILVNEVTRNRSVWGAIALCTALLVGAVYLPGTEAVLSTVDPGPVGWALVAAASAIPYVAVQGWRLLRRVLRRPAGE